MSAVFVDHLSFALGGLRESVEDAAAAERILSSASTLRSAGFDFHHRCAEGETAYDLARRTVEPLRSRLGKIDAIVYATCLPLNGNVGLQARYEESRDVKHLMDFPASHLQADFGLDGAAAIGLNQQACTGMLGSLRLARALIATEPDMGRILCLTADRFPEGALYEQSYNLISDGAAACVVSRDEGAFELVACHQITNGALAAASDDETVGSFFNYTHRAIQETLARASLTSRDLAWIVPQNTNVKAWQILARLLGVPVDRVAMRTIGAAAHLISGDNVVNLKDLDEAGLVKRGDLLLLPMAGYGMNWQCTLLREALSVAKALAELSQKLCEASQKKYVNPYEYLEWPASLERERWYTSPELVSLHGTEHWEQLDPAARQRLSFHEAVNFYSLNIHGEKALIEGLAHRLYPGGNEGWSPYLHHFLDEENKHMVYFGGFCGRYAGKVYHDRKVAFPREHAPGEEDFLFFAKVLVFEEIVDVYNLRMSKDERLEPIARQINLIHHLEETRHLVFGRAITTELFETHAPRWSADTRRSVAEYLAAYLRATWKEYTNPDVYADAGFMDPYAVARTAFDHPASRAHRREVSAGCVRFLLDHGMIEKDPLA